MKKALAIGLATVMAVSMSAPVFAEDEGKGIAKEDLKVGVIYIGDENEGYTAAHMKGIDEMEEKLGLDDSQIIEKTLIGEDEGCYDAAADLADQGCQIIFANSFGHETYILEAAGEYPEVQFCHATGTQAASSGLSNMHNYFTNIYEARYVSGVVAGLKLNEMIEDGTVKEDACKMGYVGAFPYASLMLSDFPLCICPLSIQNLIQDECQDRGEHGHTDQAETGICDDQEAEKEVREHLLRQH